MMFEHEPHAKHSSATGERLMSGTITCRDGRAAAPMACGREGRVSRLFYVRSFARPKLD
jgi:hypothetical protein